MKLFAILLFVFTASLTVFSQEIGEEVRNGQTFKVYVVEAGNTLFSLHTKYNVSVEDIVKANPSAKGGLQVGQKLYIPIEKTGGETPTYKLHIVKRKETLYGIARSYDLSVEELIKANPEIENDLKIGQELKIPVVLKEAQSDNVSLSDPKDTDTDSLEFNKNYISDTIAPLEKKKDSISNISYKIVFTDSIIEHTVQKGETLYSIARRFMVSIDTLIADNSIKNSKIDPGQVLKIKLKKERTKKIEIKEVPKKSDTIVSERSISIEKKGEYTILVALPMNLSKNPQILSGMFDENTSLNKLTDISVSFLMGAEMALDSLKKLGLKAKVEFFDTEGDLEILKNHLGIDNQKKYDIIFGPFYTHLLEYVAEWGKTNKVPVIAVTKIPTKLLENNPYLFSMIPSDLTLIAGMAKYLAKQHTLDNIIVIESENEEDKMNTAYFIDIFNKNSKGVTSIKKSTIGGISSGNLTGIIDSDKNNYFVFLSNNVQQVMKFVNTLNSTKNNSSTYKNAKTIIVGLNEWTDYSALNSYYKNRFELHFATSNYLNYETPNVKYFTTEFRSKYGSDPSKYAFHGFDVVFSQITSLFYGRGKNRGLMDAFDICPVSPQHGSENTCVFICKQSEFEILLLDIISRNNYFSR